MLCTMNISNTPNTHEELHSALAMLRYGDADAVDRFVTTLNKLTTDNDSLRPPKTAKLSDHMFMDIRVQSTESDTVNVDIALRALQDSGALDASYISNDVVENNPYLQQRKQPCKMSVLLADGDIKTKLDISAFVQIDFTCNDANGKPHVIKGVPLLIVPKLSTDVIIGLPQIVLNMPQVFISHLMAAIVAAHAQHSAATNTTANALVPIQGRDHGNLTPPETALQQHLDSHFTVLTLNIRGNRTAITHELPNFLRTSHPHDALVLTEVGLKRSEHALLRDML